MALRKYIPAFAVLVVLAILHFLGTYHHLYYIFPLYDVLMHFLGGLWVGLTALWFAVVCFHVVPVKFIRLGLLVLSATLCAAVVWEVFEFHTGLTSIYTITSAGLGYWADTIKDLAMGLLGGVVAWVFGLWSYRNK